MKSPLSSYCKRDPNQCGWAKITPIGWGVMNVAMFLCLGLVASFPAQVDHRGGRSCVARWGLLLRLGPGLKYELQKTGIMKEIEEKGFRRVAWMAQQFECPCCGARNRVGHRYCTGCRQPFYYSCARCNSFVDISFKFCPGCSISLNWTVKPRANLLSAAALTSPPSPKHKFRELILVAIAVLVLALVTTGYLSYRFSFAGSLVPVGFESYQEPASLQAYVMTAPDFQYFGNPPYVKRPGEYIYLANNADASNVSFEKLKAFIVADQTDRGLYIPGIQMCGYFAETLHNNAERAGIRAAVVIVEFEDGSAPHALNAFETTDLGLVYIDCTGARRSPAAFEDWMYKLFYPLGQDRMAYVVKGREYGTIL